MAAFINKNIENVHAEVVEMSENMYRMWVTYDIFAAEKDYDSSTGMYKAIKLTYPEGYYAMPRYLTTSELNKEFRRMRVETKDELVTMLKRMSEI